MRIFTVVEDQSHGRYAQQVEQMHTDSQPHQVGNQNEPAIRIRAIRMILPLEHQPKDHSGKEAAQGIYLRFYGTKPKGIAKRIDQRSARTGCKDANGLMNAHL